MLTVLRGQKIVQAAQPSLDPAHPSASLCLQWGDPGSLLNASPYPVSSSRLGQVTCPEKPPCQKQWRLEGPGLKMAFSWLCMLICVPSPKHFFQNELKCLPRLAGIMELRRPDQGTSPRALPGALVATSLHYVTPLHPSAFHSFLLQPGSGLMLHRELRTQLSSEEHLGQGWWYKVTSV